jgi:CotH kinase protein
MTRQLLLVVCAFACAAADPHVAAAERLPVVSIETATRIVDEPKRSARMRIQSRGRTVFRGRVGIEIRGQASQRFAKKPYAFETRVKSGGNRSVRLLGMPKGNDWILAAAHTDPSLMRDVLAYRTARRLGRYASRTRFVSLRIDGEARGVYILMEQLRRDRERVDSDALLELTTAAKLDRGDAAAGLPATGLVARVADVSKQAGAADVGAAAQAFERALYGGGPWREIVDLPAAVDYVLVQELFKNQDAFLSSTYVHRGQDRRLRMGPVWDFDLSAGSVSVGEFASAEGWLLTDRPWAERLYRAPDFVAAMRARWTQLRRDGLVEDLLAAAARQGRALRGPAAANHRRWRILGRPLFAGQPVVSSHADAVSSIRDWLQRRAAWMDTALPTLRPPA